MKPRLSSLLVAVLAFGESMSGARADFALRDGDTVVFLGDSITAARQYDRVVENYTLLRYPRRTVHFVNAGKGGDTMAGGLARLDRDVFDRGATALFVAFGFNDIGWGVHADD
ncbi:MAG TPA: GDSL-type esterase/lipase family protein, partial [Chthoniobacteraceae bacterium]|nr:GDSL-type esterase/lipase family protein [Chthoniobacteraceae bacterium]